MIRKFGASCRGAHIRDVRARAHCGECKMCVAHFGDTKVWRIVPRRHMRLIVHMLAHPHTDTHAPLLPRRILASESLT